MKALLAAQEHEDWPRVLQALLLFNEANTDRDFVPEAAETMLSFAAFEQFFDIAADPRALAYAFEAEWTTLEPVPASEWAIKSTRDGVNARFAKSSSLRAAWIEDMGITRGSLAHGHQADAYTGVWSPAEHLLPAAFVFPRLVKLWLLRVGLYASSDDDLRDIEALEQLLNVRHFAPRKLADNAPWPRIIGNAGISQWVRKAVEKHFHSTSIEDAPEGDH